MKEKILIKTLYFDAEDNTLICNIDGYSGNNNFFSVDISICENSVIKWYIHPNWEFKILNIKKIEIENDFSVKQEEFWLNFYTNKKGRFFLSLEAGDKEDLKDITNMKIGDKIEFKLQGDIFVLSFNVIRDK
jgi:hypothetical protein